ncbi:hypothetical protein [Methylobacterium nonmethylotrophicum]|uniref:Uncharacterized protein n=1 Tax=Methylobacterium nonmethylotrophicum TaxID=1141884 RepID=A0A4Z0NSN9_9HYPH|nr:hypothetical protein [Methylobacterium nonmethylotrophicum]TGD99047.1 hypothetical protein EU555_14175 [Methylobacterium nonmethylotrophicum]
MERAEILWWWTVGVLLALCAATSVAWLLDGRQIGGESVWVKPIKFQLSLALHCATLALVASGLAGTWRDGALLRWVAFASIAATGFEVAYIMVQAGRQQASHFNRDTPFLAAMYAAMAVGAVVITVAAAIVGAVAWADAGARFGPALRLAVALGLIGGTVLTLIVAFRMGGALTRHVGLEAPGAARMPLTGWSLTVGDRRVPHFFATHMMQAVPLAGLIAERTLPRAPAVGAVLLVAAGWVALTLWFFAQANRGEPVLG